MRKYLDTPSVVWEKLLLGPRSPGGSLTDRKSEEQQADEGASRTIDCQLTSEVHYADRPEPQHDDPRFNNSSLLPMDLSLGPISLPPPTKVSAPSRFLSAVTGVSFSLSV